MGDTTPTEGEGVNDGITEIEGFEDPFEDDWDDAEMKHSYDEWNRLLQEVGEEEINALNPGASASPLSTEVEEGLTEE